jgi:hypothetical protein
MDMQMLPRLDWRNRTSNVMTVLDDSSPFRDVDQGQFVADRNGVANRNGDNFVLVHYPTGKSLAGLDAFDNGNARRIGMAMHYKMNHGFLAKLLIGCWRVADNSRSMNG